MENTKAKNVIITVLGILLVAVICFIVYYIFIVNKNSISNEQQLANITKLQEEVANKEKEIENLNKELEELKNKEDINKDSQIKVENTYTVKDLVKSESETLTKNGYKYKYDMPQIVSDKANAKKINSEIKEKYNLAKQVFNNKPYNMTITYKAEITGEILKITITDSYNGWVGTGASSGKETTIIEYDFKNDKRVFSDVNQLITKLEFMENPLEKIVSIPGEPEEDAIIYSLDMVLPEFIISTPVTEKINDEILAIYNKYLEAYRDSESNKLSYRNTKVSYKSSLDKINGIITLTITEAYTDWVGSGSPNDSSTTTIKYDYVNDKRLK